MTYLNPLWVFIGLFLLVGLVFFTFAYRAFRNKRFFGGISRSFSGFVCLLISALAFLISFASWGYKALTLEQNAATVAIFETAPQRFEAVFYFKDGSSQSFDLAGDQLYVDAKFIKWHPYANLLGFRSLYELDRVSGRYLSLDDEQTQARTVYALNPERSVDAFDLAQRYQSLNFLLDTEYGSGTFQTVEDGATYHINATTSGLIVRKLE